jgi:hypothetical protein
MIELERISSTFAITIHCPKSDDGKTKMTACFVRMNSCKKSWNLLSTSIVYALETIGNIVRILFDRAFEWGSGVNAMQSRGVWSACVVWRVITLLLPKPCRCFDNIGAV